MNELFAALRQFFRGLRPWVMVSPWEQAVRVRCGKRVAVLGAGMHLKLPIVDSYYLQSVRLRVSSIGRQTVTCREGAAITFNGAVGYAIGNIEQLYRTLHHAEDTIANMVRAKIAQYIATNDLCECTPQKIERHLTQALGLGGYGLVDASIYVTEFAVVRTFRLIGDYGSGGYAAPLNTDYAQHGPPGVPPS